MYIIMNTDNNIIYYVMTNTATPGIISQYINVAK